MTEQDETNFLNNGLSKQEINEINEKPIDINLQELKSDTFYEVDDILNYSDEEKEEIDSFMSLVFKLDDMMEEWKAFYKTMEYNKFIMWYSVADNRIQNHFKEIYKSFIISAWKAKIDIVIANPMPSWKLDIQWIHAQILNILSVDREFDFWVFDNDEVMKLVFEVKR